MSLKRHQTIYQTSIRIGIFINVTLLPSLQVPSDGIKVPAPGGLKFASKINSFGKLDRSVIKR